MLNFNVTKGLLSRSIQRISKGLLYAPVLIERESAKPLSGAIHCGYWM